MRLFASLIILMLILTACGGDGSATINTQGAPLPPTQDFENSLAATYAVTEEAGSDSVVVVSPQAPSGEFEIPLPGTMVLDSGYVDENKDLVFDSLFFVRYAGPEGSEVLALELNRDGSYKFNEMPGRVSTDVVTRIDNLLDEVGFFAIGLPMLGPNIESGNYRYRLTVSRAGEQLTINAEDSFTPNEILRIFSTLMGIIVESDSTLNPTTLPSTIPTATEVSG